MPGGQGFGLRLEERMGHDEVFRILDRCQVLRLLQAGEQRASGIFRGKGHELPQAARSRDGKSGKPVFFFYCLVGHLFGLADVPDPEVVCVPSYLKTAVFPDGFGRTEKQGLALVFFQWPGKGNLHEVEPCPEGGICIGFGEAKFEAVVCGNIQESVLLQPLVRLAQECRSGG